MEPLEKALDDAFKKAPQLPENGRKGLADVMPWLTLLGGVLSLWAAWSVYRLATLADQLTTLYGSFGYTPPATSISAGVWLSLAFLVLQAVLFLVAFPALRSHRKSGWNLLFYAAIVNVVYDVVYNLFGYYTMNLGSLIFSLVGAAIGLYLLFQIRPYFGGAQTATRPAAHAAPKETTTTTKHE